MILYQELIISKIRNHAKNYESDEDCFVFCIEFVDTQESNYNKKYDNLLIKTENK